MCIIYLKAYLSTYKSLKRDEGILKNISRMKSMTRKFQLQLN